MNESKSLNQRIAELFGWTVGEKLEPTYQGKDKSMIRGLRNPTGELVWFHPLRKVTEAECWQHATDYEHDLNASMRELPEDFHIELFYESTNYWWVHLWRDHHKTLSCNGEGATPQEAAARALLTLLEAQAARP